MRIRKKYIILINSCSPKKASHQDRQQACLDTWVRDQAQLAPDTVEIFLVHADESRYFPALVDGRLWVPAKEDYQLMHFKLQHAFRWVLDNYDFDFLFKCDDDTYIFMDRLVKMLEENRDADFLGADLGRYQITPGAASGGSGYAMSPKAVKIIADYDCPVDCREDAEFSFELQRHGIPLRHIDYLEPGFSHKQYYYSDWIHNPNMITLHYSKPGDMYLIDYLKKTGQLDPTKRIAAFGSHPHWNRPIFFLTNGVFYRNKGQTEGSWRLQGNKLSLNWTTWGLETLEYDSDTLKATGPNGYVIYFEGPLPQR